MDGDKFLKYLNNTSASKTQRSLAIFLALPDCMMLQDRVFSL